MTSKRPRASKETLDEEDVSPSHEFWDYFDQDDEVDGEDEDQSAQDEDDSASFDPVLFRLSNASGELTFTEVSTGDNIRRDDLDPSDVFILDTGRACYVWVGSQADNAEKKNGIPYATVRIYICLGCLKSLHFHASLISTQHFEGSYKSPD
ncbi:gelsolin-like protein 2 [Diadema antillarum]|uniref:gelsolin-like protein 2 n=1 Tax=Diadema antillarum TaxID=105358 RepID=UPI003A845A54